MRITVTVTDHAALRRAVAGLRSVDDAGDALLEKLERAVNSEAVTARACRTPRPQPHRVDDAAVLAAWNMHHGNVSAVAAALGIARSTVRDRVAKYGRPLIGAARAANDG